MMRWLLDENMPLAVGRRLGAMGHDVVMVVETARSSLDEAVLAMAREQQRILVSFDRDFGDLIYGRGLPAPRSVVYLRIELPPSTQVDTLAHLLAAFDPDLLDGYFTVVSDGGIRRRALPV
ncbi:DUF5615 family PIN-like protein [Myxococcota bacterium]|nr:DUF5615 family PIN-like protein [Myxococcota bacterium]